MKTKETLYIYARVSTVEQVDKNLSLPRQKELGIQKAIELGMSYKIYVEEGQSASAENLDNRPKMAELLALVREGLVKHMFVFDQTRLSRNDITKALITQSLKKKGVQLYTSSKTFDFNNVEDLLTYSIVEAIENYESSLRKRRFQLGYISGNKKGQFLKVMPPYGYKKDENKMLVVDAEEKKIFLKIVDLYLNKNFGTNQIANWLNQNNIPTKSQKIYKNGYTLKQDVSNRKKTINKKVNKWNPGTINEMLKHELYTGVRKFKTGPNSYDTVHCQPLITRAIFDKIQTLRQANAITKKKQDKYFYLLKELLQCGNCGQPMYGRVKPNRSEFTYRCNSKRAINSECKSRGINIDKLNLLVWNAFIESSFYHKQINKKILAQLKDKKGLQTRLKELELKLKKLESTDKLLDIQKKELLRKSIDPRVKGVAYNELMDELIAESKENNDNKTACLINIKRITEQINNQKQAKSELSQGIELFEDAQRELSSFNPPFDTLEKQQAARKLLGEAIKNIEVEYLPEKREHKIQILFNAQGGFQEKKGITSGQRKDEIKLATRAMSITFTSGNATLNVKFKKPDALITPDSKNSTTLKKMTSKLPPLKTLLHHLLYDAVI